MLFLPIKHLEKLHRAFGGHIIFKNLRNEQGFYILYLRIRGIVDHKWVYDRNNVCLLHSYENLCFWLHE
jgi:hypothetical protein